MGGLLDGEVGLVGEADEVWRWEELDDEMVGGRGWMMRCG